MKLRFTHTTLICIFVLISQSVLASISATVPHDCVATPAEKNEWVKKNHELEFLYETKGQYSPEFKKKYLAFVTEYPNMSGYQFSFGNKKMFVYRSAILSDNLKCLASLIKEEQLKNIIYLYSGKYVNEEVIPFKEENLLKKLGGQTYIRVLNFSDAFHNEKERKQLEKRVADIINLISTLGGTTLIHCIEGMHRTAVVYGAMDKCINKMPMNKIIHDYKKHTHSLHKKTLYAYKQSDIDFIKQFDCKKLALY